MFSLRNRRFHSNPALLYIQMFSKVFFFFYQKKLQNMGDKFVLLKQKNHPNIIPTYNDLINKSTEQILELYAKSKMALIFNGPYFSEPIQANTIPLIAYPELALTERPTEYSTAPYYLSFEELQYQKQLALFVKPEVEEFEIPLFKIVFNLDDVKTGKDILKLIDDNFDLPHSNGSTTSFWPSDTAQNIFQKARNENIKFCCQLEEKSLKLIKKRVDILKEINDTEYRYIEDLSVILDIYQPFLAKSSSFNASEMNTIFKDIPTIRNFHRNFSENIKEREQKYE
ncbi:hypothetical protein TRFO_17443 [Tritrichomonas foetus]|uniref:DH domain-containing protein n=1 Tax=Tritrichomonas foetus TaxID=1144522 RepID=A0A1J4KNK6_9EUKA|nr:hypothetical protein TRFO_17443 [Tritrichomonas foetus]|eukprot:OHT12714.1 hypothetical protein TRFO_17443 [Tritrichomonas foetus]